MGQTVTLTGAHVKIFLNNKVYPLVQSINFTVDYGENGIGQIDSAYVAEIAPTKVVVSGSVNGIRVKNSGGLQGIGVRTLFSDIFKSPYVSIRVQDRQSQEDILFVPQAKISQESHSVSAKGTYKLNFNFIGVQPLFALDRS